MTKDAFGDRMKQYEMVETGRKFLPLLPVYARLDGRGFSKFTQGLKRPFDERLSQVMIDVTKFLVKETHACMGYTQSDEISLCWYSNNYDSTIFFDGKVQKMVSSLAAMVSSEFNFMCQSVDGLAERVRKKRATFDARVYQLPTLYECSNAFLWREMDATKNAVSMAARSFFSHNSLQNLNGSQMQEKMFQEAGVNFNDYPAFFKRGTFVSRRSVTRNLTEEELQSIPEAYRSSNPITRTEVLALDVPKFVSVKNRDDFIFFGADPIAA